MYITNFCIFALGSLTLPGKSNAIAPKTKIPNINESNRNNGAIDDSELPIRYRRTDILPEEMLYIEVFSIMYGIAAGFCIF